jgi:16S rRNA (guanine527-N7)-methyltransferase
MSVAPRRNVPDFGAEEFAKATDVSRETLARLKAYVGLLADWNARHNLVSRNSLEDVWRRHIWDSAQLISFVPDTAQSLVDLGSGAGFPGLVLAVMLRERPGFKTVLYESIAKKCAFLTAAAERMQIVVEVRKARVEEAGPEPFDVVTARACAPLAKLLGYARSFQGPYTTNLFLKGQNVEAELTKAHISWKLNAVRHESLTGPGGVILEIRDIAPKDSKHVTLRSQTRRC